MTEQKLYKLTDIQDEDNSSIETLEGMRDFLQSFWGSNPSEDMTDEEHDEWIDEIGQSNESELFDMLGGVGYYFEDVE